MANQTGAFPITSELIERIERLEKALTSHTQILEGVRVRQMSHDTLLKVVHGDMQSRQLAAAAPSRWARWAKSVRRVLHV